MSSKGFGTWRTRRGLGNFTALYEVMTNNHCHELMTYTVPDVQYVGFSSSGSRRARGYQPHFPDMESRVPDLVVIYFLETGFHEHAGLLSGYLAGDTLELCPLASMPRKLG